MRRADFNYELPPELIAQAPLPERAASRLLVVPGGEADFLDRQIADLPDLLRPQDLLVFNDTRVVAARLHARKPTGGQVEVLLERALPGGEALVQARSSKGLRVDGELLTAGGTLRVIEREGELWRIATPGDSLTFFEQHGEIPLPPYIERAADASDRERYQSVFARDPGAVAAPTASLHFDAALLQALAARGIASATVTLHVGAGTFQPMRAEDPDDHVMHAERYAVPQATVDAVAATRARGGRIVAVGTTVARTLEAAAAEGELRAGAGETRLFVRPGYAFRIVDVLLTNFHLPESTLLMLVAALAGRERMLAAYAHAIARRYRFFSYGDAMLILPPDARSAGC
ncbi:MAG: tRNA preQ1(34) S-adenosylmethionine ribosyltransferase-isomerase QueA [Steroidobacteraceae bacterium]